MEKLTNRERAIVRLTRMRWRRFTKGSQKILWAALAVAGISFWLGMERNLSCPDVEVGDTYSVECTCERDGSRWRYGICESDPVEWSAADNIALAMLDRQDDEGGTPLIELEIRDVFRGGLPKGENIVLRGGDANRLLGEIARHPHGSAEGPFVVMLRAWGEGVERWQFLDGGYYPYRDATDGQPAMVFLKPRDIQVFGGKAGWAYSEPPAMVPIRDFMFSLWLASPVR